MSLTFGAHPLLRFHFSVSRVLRVDDSDPRRFCDVGHERKTDGHFLSENTKKKKKHPIDKYIIVVLCVCVHVNNGYGNLISIHSRSGCPRSCLACLCRLTMTCDSAEKKKKKRKIVVKQRSIERQSPLLPAGIEKTTYIFYVRYGKVGLVVRRPVMRRRVVGTASHAAARRSAAAAHRRRVRRFHFAGFQKVTASGKHGRTQTALLNETKKKKKTGYAKILSLKIHKSRNLF